VDQSAESAAQFSSWFSIHNALVAFSAVLRFLPIHPWGAAPGSALTGARLALITDSRSGFQHKLSVPPAWDTVPSLS